MINNKKGFFMSLVTDMWGWFIFFLGILFWLFIFMVLSKGITYEIQEKTAYLSDDGILLAYLRTSVTEKENIADLIVAAYQGADKEKLKEELNKILNHVYGRAKPVCWKLWYYEKDSKKLLVEEECGSEKNELFDAETIMPLPYHQEDKTIKIKLVILGYK